jgi:translocation and assembly module TamB
MNVKLGRVQVSRGNSIRVTLDGQAKVSVAGEQASREEAGTRVNGQIHTTGGWVDVQGKKFEIEKGTITFAGESPPNPTVDATATWTAADGTKVFVDYLGPVKTGKVTMRSEPPRPKNEILALVVFGTSDGANPTPAPPGKQADGTTKAAFGIGGGFAAQGLSEALDDLAGIQATARIDTTATNNPRPEVEVQVTSRVGVSFAHVIGTPPITEPDRNLASVELRVHRNWSVDVTVGDHGRATADAVWQRRY